MMLGVGGSIAGVASELIFQRSFVRLEKHSIPVVTAVAIANVIENQLTGFVSECFTLCTITQTG
jgi:hypothetical protein